MNKLEMLNSFKQRFEGNLNPSLQSIKYCQTENSAIIELQFLNDPEIKSIDLKFIGGDLTENEDGTYKDILQMFNPEADIVDNAKLFLALDDYSFIMCIDDVLTEEAINKILAENEPQTK